MKSLPSLDSKYKIKIFTETADAEAGGAGPRGGAAQLAALVAGVTRPVGPRRG